MSYAHQIPMKSENFFPISSKENPPKPLTFILIPLQFSIIISEPLTEVFLEMKKSENR